MLKNAQTYFAHIARFLKHVRPFFNILHERVNPFHASVTIYYDTFFSFLQQILEMLKSMSTMENKGKHWYGMG